MLSFKEKQKELWDRQDALKGLFDAHRDKETGQPVFPPDVAVEVRKRNDELTTLGKEVEALKAELQLEEGLDAALKARKAPVSALPFDGGPAGTGGAIVAAQDRYGNPLPVKSLGQQFVESEAYKSMSGLNRPSGIGRTHVIWDVDDISPSEAAKATFTTALSTFTGYDRQPFVLLGQQPLTVANLLAQGETTMNTIRYPQEDTYTNAATTVSEGGTKPEASFDTSEVDAPVRKIAVVIKATEEMWDDFPVIRDYLNERGRFMVGQTLEAQILTGDGIAPNMTGILNTVGIQTQATGSDSNADAIYKALTKVRTVGFFEPDGVVIHPTNWTPIRLMKTTTGEYIWGAPSEVGPERIWGKQTVVTTGITANTGLVGAFRLGAQIFYRMGLRMEATNSDGTDFVKNIIAIRIELRAALAVYRPKAFSSITSLGT